MSASSSAPTYPYPSYPQKPPPQLPYSYSDGSAPPAPPAAYPYPSAAEASSALQPAGAPHPASYSAHIAQGVPVSGGNYPYGQANPAEVHLAPGQHPGPVYYTTGPTTVVYTSDPGCCGLQWVLFICGWLFSPIICCVGACLPMCNKDFGQGRERAGWIANVVGSIVGTILYVVIIGVWVVAASSAAVTYNSYDDGGWSNNYN